MLLGLLLLILASGNEQSGAAPKAVLLLNPPWTTVFKGERMTLTCRGSHFPAQGDTSWYYEQYLLKEKSENIQAKLSGNYQCKTQGSSLSDWVHVVVSSDWLILQASHPVFEGDNVTLRCRGKEEEEIIEKIYYKNREELHNYKNSDIITVKARDNDKYYCAASGEGILTTWTEISEPLRIQVQELFPHPVLRTSPSQPTEGNLVTLRCETWLPPTKSHTKLQFCFFREGQALLPGWSRSPELRISTLWSEDSGSYWCEAEAVTHGIRKRSQKSKIYVQRIPVSDVNLEIRPSGGQVVEGENLVLVCSAAKGTGNVIFSWHREGTVRSLGRKYQRSLSAELQVPNVKERDTGRYYCSADNIYGPIYSKLIGVTVRIPASRPVLTLRAVEAQAVVGDVVELHCEAQRGSPPILYRFYHEDVTLENSSVPSGGGASFNLSLTEEHSGNYSCEADNGLGAQHSDAVALHITVPVSHPVLTLRAPRAQAVVGDVVELHCEAQRGSPPILYRFYHEDVTLENSSAPSGGGASFNLSLTEEHSGNYSCEADNGLGAQRSEVVTLHVTVSCPVLTFGAAGARTVVGDVVELHCEAQRGSPPILYWFYHEDVTLRRGSAPSGRVSFNLSLTTAHSGSYSCEANNGLGAQHSEVVPVNVTGPSGNRNGLITAGVIGGLLSILGLAATAALLNHFRTHRKSGGTSAPETPSSQEFQGPSLSRTSSTNPQGPTSSEMSSGMEVQPVYGNVNPEQSDLVYSEVWITQHKKDSASSPRTHLKATDSPVIYSELKRAHPDDSTAQASSRDTDQEDSAENYENVP